MRPAARWAVERMIELAITSSERTAWTVTLILGVVVLAVVIALLTILLRLVREIDRGVAGVWESAKRVAANTATTWQLNQTAAVLEEIKKEALLHDEFLASKQ